VTTEITAFAPPDFGADDVPGRHGWRAVSYYAVEILLFLLLMATFAAIRFQDDLLSRTIVIEPSQMSRYGIFVFHYGDDGSKGNSTAETDPRAPLHWRCALRPKFEYPYCGYGLVLSAQTPDRGIDLSGFDSIRLDLDYHGPFDRIRLFLKNFDPRYSKPRDPFTLKSNLIEAEVHQGHNIVDLKLSHFSVTEWWIARNKIRPTLSATQFDNITQMEFQTGQLALPGNYDIRIRKITLRGRLIDQGTWYYALLVTWAGLIFVYLIHRIIRLRQDLKQRLQSQGAAIRLARYAEESARRDHLTRLLNRAGVAELYHRMAMDRKRQGTFAVILFDVDHFKQVNDRHGHNAGDQVLVAIATILGQVMRASDIVGRWGGEEFLLICNVEDEADAMRIACKLHEAIDCHDFPVVGHVTASFGVYHGSGKMDALERVTSRADAALYQAKEAGRNRVVSCSQGKRVAA